MLDVFVRMCKYNSFDTYSIVHNSEVHMQTTTQEDTEVHMKTAIKDENKTQEDDIYNDIVLLDDQQYIYNQLFCTERYGKINTVLVSCI